MVSSEQGNKVVEELVRDDLARKYGLGPAQVQTMKTSYYLVS